MVGDGTLDVAELIEDELLLALPMRACVEERCANRPPLEYGPAVEADQDNPFAVLSELKQRGAGEEHGN